ncbi:MAG: hypothetical protein M3229_01685, partial [Actinomycetota bacterium]|nr:hypothetical protein [Actinomycetota bacterium]
WTAFGSPLRLQPPMRALNVQLTGSQLMQVEELEQAELDVGDCCEDVEPVNHAGENAADVLIALLLES